MMRLFVLSFLVASLCACTNSVMDVGDYKITQQMVDDRDQLIRMSYPNEKRSLGLLQLEKAYVDAQILMNNGHVIDDAVLEKEKNRIDKNTQAPDKLQMVKDIFGDRTDDYLSVFILPTYARRVIYYEFFLNDETVQAESYAKASAFLKSVLADVSQWKTLVSAEDIVSVKAKVSLAMGFEFIREDDDMAGASGGGIVDQSPGAAKQAEMQAKMKARTERAVSEAGKKFIAELIGPTSEGSVVNKIINQGETGWMIVRYAGKTKSVADSYDLDVAIIRKRDFQQWHTAEVDKVKVVKK